MLTLAPLGVLPALTDEPAAAPAEEIPAEWRSPALCGPEDTPETGIQGDVPRADQESGRAEEGYNCGLAVIGHNGFAGGLSSALAWSGHCAYVQVRSGQGVRVVDVADPTAPVVTTELVSGGGSENLHAVTAQGRALLVAARPKQDGVVPVDVFDVHHCTDPQLLGTIDFPGGPRDVAGPVHNVALSPDGTQVWGTMPLQVADISNLGDPSTWTPDNLQCEIVTQYHPAYTEPSPLCEVTGGSPPQLSHEVTFDVDGTRLYLGGQQPQPPEELLHVVDLTTSPPEVISTTRGPGHSIRRATIGGTPFLLHSDETAPGIPQPAERRANGCAGDNTADDARGDVDGNPATPFVGPAEPLLTDLSDETAPERISQLRLAINRPEPEICAAALDSAVNSTSHYLGVDDPDDTTFAMLPMKNGGLRIFDVRDSESPVEVAYFNPAQFRADDGSAVLDRARNHTFYNAARGHIWLLTETGGFWVLELEPQIRQALDLHPTASRYPEGRPARPASLASVAEFATTSVAADHGHRYYCRLHGDHPRC